MRTIDFPFGAQSELFLFKIVGMLIELPTTCVDMPCCSEDKTLINETVRLDNEEISQNSGGVYEVVFFCEGKALCYREET